MSTPGDGYEDNSITSSSSRQTGLKETMKYDHLKRKLDHDGSDCKTGLDVDAADGYGQVRPNSNLVDSEEYQHLNHDKKTIDTEHGYGKLRKDRKS